MSRYIVPKRFLEIVESACNYDPRISAAFAAVPRELFVEDGLRTMAYQDTALPIGFGQTISQPTTVAHMLFKLQVQGGDSVLEIGSGSGYLTALLAKLALNVYAVELLPALFERTRQILRKMHMTNVKLKLGDGAAGWSECAPFDKIIVSAGATRIPEGLASQLKEGGTLVIPVGSRLMTCRKVDGEFIVEEGIGVSFVDFVGS